MYAPPQSTQSWPYMQRWQKPSDLTGHASVPSVCRLDSARVSRISEPGMRPSSQIPLDARLCELSTPGMQSLKHHMGGGGVRGGGGTGGDFGGKKWPGENGGGGGYGGNAGGKLSDAPRSCTHIWCSDSVGSGASLPSSQYECWLRSKPLPALHLLPGKR